MPVRRQLYAMRCFGLILTCSLALVTCRPQGHEADGTKAATVEPQVEVERQLIREVTPLNGQAPPLSHHLTQRKIDENTRNILEKIAEVNKQQGLAQKKQRPSYFHFPFSYSRSQDEQRASNFKFSRDPFSNPILDYLNKNDENVNIPLPSFRRPNLDSGTSMTDTNPEISPEDNIPGQYIKRKITHYQSIVMPNPYMTQFPNFDLPYQQPPGYFYNTPMQPKPNQNGTQKDAVDNIKDILMSSNNPYYHQPQQNLPKLIKARQNWNWPGANLFPIYIRDPFLQMYYAVTNMIEYGPSAGNEGPCKLTPRPQGSRVKTNPNQKNAQQVSIEMHKRDGVDVIGVDEGSNLSEDIKYLDVEDIDVGDDDLVRFTINLPTTSTGGRGFKDDIKPDKMNWNDYLNARNNTFLSHLVTGKLEFTSTSPSPILQVEELDDDPIEAEKADDINVSNENSRKVFSKDNTGNGIFIQRLKVRKGGVAIAGPGGIATAGSGGTAIVGPDGVAYTHPDGLAIAGSGTKVVAVDPAIDLNEVIKDSVLNGTRHVPNTRVGKVVAVGPVVYYNRGSSNISPSAWLAFPQRMVNTAIIRTPSASSQFYHFPKYHLRSNIQTANEYRAILKNNSLGEPRNFFPSSVQKDNLRLNDKGNSGKNNKPPSLAPYRLSPLFHFIQNQNTLEQGKIIKFRTTNGVKEDDIITLILKPQSTAVAGVEGKAVSNPLSRAVLREGTNVDILFEPAAVAIAGPGGIAHAQSDLEISYEYV